MKLSFVDKVSDPEKTFLYTDNVLFLNTNPRKSSMLVQRTTSSKSFITFHECCSEDMDITNGVTIIEDNITKILASNKIITHAEGVVNERV